MMSAQTTVRSMFMATPLFATSVSGRSAAAGVVPAVREGMCGGADSCAAGGFAISLRMYSTPAPNTAKYTTTKASSEAATPVPPAATPIPRCAIRPWTVQGCRPTSVVIPAGQHGDQPRGPHRQREAMQPRPVVEPAAGAGQQAHRPQRGHEKAQADHDCGRPRRRYPPAAGRPPARCPGPSAARFMSCLRMSEDASDLDA